MISLSIRFLIALSGNSGAYRDICCLLMPFSCTKLQRISRFSSSKESIDRLFINSRKLRISTFSFVIAVRLLRNITLILPTFTLRSLEVSLFVQISVVFGTCVVSPYLLSAEVPCKSVYLAAFSMYCILDYFIRVQNTCTKWRLRWNIVNSSFISDNLFRFA